MNVRDCINNIEILFIKMDYKYYLLYFVLHEVQNTTFKRKKNSVKIKNE